MGDAGRGATLLVSLSSRLNDVLSLAKLDPVEPTKHARSRLPIMAAIEVCRRLSCGACHRLEHERMSIAQRAARPSRERRLRSDLFAGEREFVATTTLRGGCSGHDRGARIAVASICGGAGRVAAAAPGFRV